MTDIIPTPHYSFLNISNSTEISIVTNIIISQLLGAVEHQSLTAGFSGANNRGYCSCTGPMLGAGG